MVLQLIQSSGFTADTELDASTDLPLPHPAHYGVVMTVRAVSLLVPFGSVLPRLVPRAWLLVGCGDVLYVHLSFLVYFF